MEQAKTLEQVGTSKTHPILIAAGVAVLIFCALGAAALTGILPISKGDATVAPQQAQPTQAQVQPAPAAKPAQPQAKPASQPQPKVAAAPCATCG